MRGPVDFLNLSFSILSGILLDVKQHDENFKKKVQTRSPRYRPNTLRQICAVRVALTCPSGAILWLLNVANTP